MHKKFLWLHQIIFPIAFIALFITFFGSASAVLYTRQLYFEIYAPSQEASGHKKIMAKEAGKQVIGKLNTPHFSCNLVHDFPNSCVSYFQINSHDDGKEPSIPLGIFLTSHFTSQGQFPAYKEEVFSPDWIRKRLESIPKKDDPPPTILWMISLQDGRGVSLHLAERNKDHFEENLHTIKSLFGLPLELQKSIALKAESEEDKPTSPVLSIEQLIEALRKVQVTQEGMA